jgi:hypothetical protein
VVEGIEVLDFFLMDGAIHLQVKDEIWRVPTNGDSAQILARASADTLAGRAGVLYYTDAEGTVWRLRTNEATPRALATFHGAVKQVRADVRGGAIVSLTGIGACSATIVRVADDGSKERLAGNLADNALLLDSDRDVVYSTDDLIRRIAR